MAKRQLIECDWCENAEEFGEEESPVGWLTVFADGEEWHCCSWRCVEAFARSRAEQQERLGLVRLTLQKEN